MKLIPFSRLYDSIEPIYDEYLDKISGLIKKTEFIGGEEVESFALEFAAWTGTKYAVGTANGTDSLIIALKALGIGPGDKVLVPVNTFIATSESVTMVGAEVDFIDVEEDYYTMSPEGLEGYLNSSKGSNVKAIIPVHLYGQMADMSSLCDIARKHGLKVIEDAAQAHGATLQGRQPGYFGDIATYSFYPGKNIGAFGDAGAITTNDVALYKKCKMLINHGRWEAKYEHEIEGLNMRLDTLQAAVLRIKLKHIDAWTISRKKVAKEYLSRLEGIDVVVTPKIRPGADPVWHIFAIQINARDFLAKRLKEIGVSTGVHYPIPLHQQPAYANKNYLPGDFKVAEAQAKRQLSLPIWPEMRDEEIRYVVEGIQKILT